MLMYTVNNNIHSPSVCLELLLPELYMLSV